MSELPRVQVPLMLSLEIQAGGERRVLRYLGFPHMCVEFAGENNERRSFPSTELLDRIVTRAALREGHAVDGAAVVAGLDQVAEAERGGRADVPPALAQVLRAKRTANRVTCAHALGSELRGGQLRWLDADEDGIWIVEPELGAEDGVVFTPASPAAVAERILELLPHA